MLTIRDKAERFPPIVCRLLARRRVRHDYVEAMTDDEIARSSGLGMAAVKRLSWTHSWDEIPLAEMLAFTKACGISFDCRRSIQRNTRFLVNGEWSHITRSPVLTTFYAPLFNEWRSKQRK